MSPLGVAGGLQEITSVKLSGEYVRKSLTGPDTAEMSCNLYLVRCLMIIILSWHNKVV